MEMLREVFDSLDSTNQVQLLLAFIACTAYVFAQGSLLPARARRLAWLASAAGAAGFAIESPDWTLGTMLVGFAIAGLGSFVALVWLTSRLLGLGREPEPAGPPSESAFDSSFPVAADLPRPRGPQPTGPAHLSA